MTQDEAWKKNYDEVMSFITENGRNLSKYNLEERRLYTWLKHQRKVMNAGEMKEGRGKREEGRGWKEEGRGKM